MTCGRCGTDPRGTSWEPDVCWYCLAPHVLTMLGDAWAMRAPRGRGADAAGSGERVQS